MKRRFQYSLRFLLCFCTVVAIFVGWHANRARHQREIVAAVKVAGGGSAYTHQDTLPGGYSHDPPPVPAWLRRLIGDEYFQELAFVNLRWASISDQLFEQVSRGSTIRELMLGNEQITDEHLRYVGRMANVRWISFGVGKDEKPPIITAAGIKHLASCRTIENLIFNNQCRPTNEGMAYIGQMRNLRELIFDDASVTDAGIEELRGLPSLEILEIVGSSITNKGLSYLPSMPKLKNLMVQNALINDEGMAHIGRCENLEEVMIICTTPYNITDDGVQALKALKKAKRIVVCSNPVTDSGVTKLQQALPSCKVVKW